MNFFKYLFYKSYSSKNQADRMTSEGKASLSLSLWITINIASILSLAFAYFNFRDMLAVLYNSLIVFSFIIVVIYFLFLSKSQYKKVVDEFSKKPYNKKMEIARWIYIIATPLVFIGSVILHGNIESQILHNDPVFTKALITREHPGSRGGWKSRYFNYTFEVDGKKYGHYWVYPVDVNKIREGDSCQVVYARSNPEINGVVYEKNSEKVIITYRKP